VTTKAQVSIDSIRQAGRPMPADNIPCGEFVLEGRLIERRRVRVDAGFASVRAAGNIQS
jgi:hypothetical protein